MPFITLPRMESGWSCALAVCKLLRKRAIVRANMTEKVNALLIVKFDANLEMKVPLLLKKKAFHYDKSPPSGGCLVRWRNNEISFSSAFSICESVNVKDVSCSRICAAVILN